MLDIPSAEFQLQCRTQRAVVSDNSLADATVYSAFAVREGTEYNTLLQVELNDAKDGKICKLFFDTYFSTTQYVQINGKITTDKESCHF